MSAGNPLPLRTPGVDQAHIYMKLTPAKGRTVSANALGIQLRKEFEEVGGVNVSVFSGGFGGAFKELQLQLRGPDAVTLAQLGEKALAVARTIPGAVDVSLSARGPREELTVDIDRSLAGSLGLTVGQVGQAMRVAFAGIDAGDWVDPTGKTRDVRIRLAPDARQRAVDLERLPLTVFGADGTPRVVPLGQVARIAVERAPAQIDHLDRTRVITLEANTDGRPLSDVVAPMIEKVSALEFPPGYVMSEGGWNQEQNDTFSSIFTALGIAVMLMYLILVRPVRVVPRSDRDPGVAATLADRRGPRADRHRRHPQHH